MKNQIIWLGHDSFKIKGEKTIYIDPWKLKDGDPADIILITHDHFDHFSQEDINKVRNDDTVLVTNKTVATSLTGPVRTVQAGDKLSVQGVDIGAANWQKRNITMYVFHFWNNICISGMI